MTTRENRLLEEAAPVPTADQAGTHDTRSGTDGLVTDAARWRRLCASPYIGEILAEWELDRQWWALRQASHAISSAADWRRISAEPTYAELARRRSTYDRPPLSAEEIRANARSSWAAYPAGPYYYRAARVRCASRG